MNRSLNDLKSIKDNPLELGWTRDEVIEAMMPAIKSQASYVVHKLQGQTTFNIDDGISAGMEAVNTALDNFRGGIASFPTYVYHAIGTAIKRASAKEANEFNATDKQTYDGKLDWLGLKGDKLKERLTKKHNRIPEPASDANHNPKLIAHLLDSPGTGLTDSEKFVLKASVSASTAQIAAALAGPGKPPLSAARISQIRTSAIRKITEYTKARDFSAPDDAVDKLNLESKKNGVSSEI